jgi:hypothetical protein
VACLHLYRNSLCFAPRRRFWQYFPRARWLEKGEEEELVDECESVFLVQNSFFYQHLTISVVPRHQHPQLLEPDLQALNLFSPSTWYVPIKCQPHPPKILLPAGRMVSQQRRYPPIVNLIVSIHSRRPPPRCTTHQITHVWWWTLPDISAIFCKTCENVERAKRSNVSEAPVRTT